MSRLPIIPKKHFDIKTKFIKGGKLTLTPFNVGMESLLLEVKDGTPEEKKAAIQQIIESCLVTKDIEVDKIPLFLIEEIFLRLRQNSIGEIIDKQYQCTNEVEEGKTCNSPMSLKLDLNEFKLIESPGHTKTIMVSDPIGIVFRYPNLAMADVSGQEQGETETILSCIETIFNGDDVYSAEDSTREELLEFWNQFSLLQKKDVFDKFFHSMPKFNHEKDLVCPKCGYNHKLKFSSIEDVFQQ